MKRFISVNTNSLIWIVILLVSFIAIPFASVILIDGTGKPAALAIAIGMGYATLLNQIYKNIFSKEFIRFSLSLGISREKLFVLSMRKIIISSLMICLVTLPFLINQNTKILLIYSFSLLFSILLILFSYIYDHLRKNPLIYMVVPILFGISNVADWLVILILLAGTIGFLLVLRSIYHNGELS